ncbi:hypothetical protein ACTHGU_01135 [Chitinophagaceae bacterium MMS25-I14]
MNPFQFITSLFKKPEIQASHIPIGRQNWTNKEVSDFLLCLKQVIKWTEKLSKNFDYEKGFYGTVFRQTNPVIDGTLLYNFDGDYTTWNLDDYNHVLYEKLLEMAINERDKDYTANLKKLSASGRILSFQTCVTTHDGAPIAESRHFVDEGDIPPIDTWFYLKNDYYHSEYLCPHTLFCWIPKSFEREMQNAIDVEILDSYRWLDENDQQMDYMIKNAE